MWEEARCLNDGAVVDNYWTNLVAISTVMISIYRAMFIGLKVYQWYLLVNQGPLHATILTPKGLIQTLGTFWGQILEHSGMFAR